MKSELLQFECKKFEELSAQVPEGKKREMGKAEHPPQLLFVNDHHSPHVIGITKADRIMKLPLYQCH